jgi:peptidyl-prolyl cis-trans isomerase B (cyclophilin B)
MKKLIGALLYVAGAGMASAQQTYTWTGKPIFDIVAKRNNQTLGVIKIELFPRIAPKHTRSFDSLVSVQFYDTTAFHRVIPGFVIQGGDPNSRHGPTSTWGQGDPSQPTVPAEFSLAKHLRGIVSGARKANDINSYTSQFFICVANTPNLNGQYSIFGRVLAGMDVVDTIVSAPRNMTTNMPLQKIEMFVTRNGSNDTVPQAPALINPPAAQNYTTPPTAVQLKWDAVQDAQLYELQVAQDSAFNLMIVDMKINAYSYNFMNPSPNNTYFWRVRANNGGHFSPWAMRMFTTTEEITTSLTGGVKGNPRVFPNPSAGTFTFENLEPGLDLNIYNTTGDLVRKVKTGNEKVTLDLRDLPAGNYLYKVGAGAGTIFSGTLLLR